MMLSLVCGLYTAWHDLFALPLGVIGRLCSVIVAFPDIFCINFDALRDSLHKMSNLFSGKI